MNYAIFGRSNVISLSFIFLWTTAASFSFRPLHHWNCVVYNSKRSIKQPVYIYQNVDSELWVIFNFKIIRTGEVTHQQQNMDQIYGCVCFFFSLRNQHQQQKAKRDSMMMIYQIKLTKGEEARSLFLRNQKSVKKKERKFSSS